MSTTPRRELKKNRAQYDEQTFWDKMGNYAKQLGLKALYSVFLLFFALKSETTPKWAKGVTLGALGYLLNPIDLLPDLTPVLGYTDDIGIITFGLATVAAHISPAVREKAREQLKIWAGDYDLTELAEVDQMLEEKTQFTKKLDAQPKPGVVVKPKGLV